MPFTKGHTITSGKKHPMYGKHHSNKSKEKMSKSHKNISN